MGPGRHFATSASDRQVGSTPASDALEETRSRLSAVATLQRQLFAAQRSLQDERAETQRANVRTEHLQRQLDGALRKLTSTQSQLAEARADLANARWAADSLKRQLDVEARAAERRLQLIVTELRAFIESNGRCQQILLRVARKAIGMSVPAASDGTITKLEEAAPADPRVPLRAVVPAGGVEDESESPAREGAPCSPPAVAGSGGEYHGRPERTGTTPDAVEEQTAMIIDLTSSWPEASNDDFFSPLTTTSEHQIIDDHNQLDMSRLSAQSYMKSFRTRRSRRPSSGRA